jgi:hypothetical protein
MKDLLILSDLSKAEIWPSDSITGTTTAGLGSYAVSYTLLDHGKNPVNL